MTTLFEPLREALRGLFGQEVVPLVPDLVAVVAYAAIPLVFILLYGLVAILGEMKISAWVQDRVGPMRTGPKGLLQPLADILKLIQKEDMRPTGADRTLYGLAPYLTFIGSYMAFAALPFSAIYVGARLNTGLFYVISIGSLVVVSILIAGWGSNSKYSLLGALRSSAQMVSYEVAIGFVLVTVVLWAGSFNLSAIVLAQQNLYGLPINGFVLNPLLFPMWVMFLISSMAETQRAPFDLTEAESELVAGAEGSSS